MNIKSIIACEQNSIEKMKKYQLPNKFKKIGLVILVFSFLTLIANKLLLESIIEVRLIAKYGMLIGLLIMSISKEKIEDEFLSNLRMQSYAFAFIGGVIITLLNPVSVYIVNLFFEKQKENFGGVGDWQILWILLSVQVFYFEFLKRMHK